MRRRLATWAVAGLAVASCAAFLPSRVTVRNAGNESVRNVVVGIAGWRGVRAEIPPGKSATFIHYADRDGEILVRYEVNGRQVHRRFEYVSRYVSVRCEVSVGRNGDPAIRC